MSDDQDNRSSGHTRATEFWRSMGTGEYAAPMAGDGLPGAAPLADAMLSRRDWLKLMGASFALAGLGGCDGAPEEDIVPYVRAPQSITAGEPRHYATATLLDGYACGVIATSYMGRPVKLEGNPRHPASRGATDVFAQAAVLELWDPERSALIRHQGLTATWEGFLKAVQQRLPDWTAGRGGSLRILTETVTSPTLAAQLEGLGQRYPGFRWHQYQPVNDDQAHAGARLAFDTMVEPRWYFDNAEVVVSVDCDFLGPGAGQVSWSRAFMQRRRPGEQHPPDMNRLYVLEPTPTPTGAVADHRFALSPAAIETWLYALARALGAGISAPPLAPLEQRRLQTIADDLQSHRGRSLLVAGRSQPAAVHALVHWINDRLGNVGHTLDYQAPAQARVEDQTQSLRELVEDMRSGSVDSLLIIEGNPVYTAPADLAFPEALARVPFSTHLSLYDDETSAQTRWHLPLAHYLERWGDARARDGSVCLLQPLIAPLQGGYSPHRLLAVLAGETGSDELDMVRAHWRQQLGATDFDRRWREALRAGVIDATEQSLQTPSLRADMIARLPGATEATQALTLALMPDPAVWDGRFANNAWLQELPRPLTQLTWDNAVQVAPALARRMGLGSGDRVEIRAGDQALAAAVWVAPGQASQVITLNLGYGRTRAGQVGNDCGFDAYRLRISSSPWYRGEVRLRRLEGRYPFATTQTHHDMEGREPIRRGTLSDYRNNPGFASNDEGQRASLYPDYPYPGHAWGMFINLNTCIGCNACTIACQAENNIPIVGKEEVRRGREMHWIRVDRYHEGPADSPHTFFQPVPCMHCEHAPCELVCPVGATVHDSEGLNVQVYNRCIGTRFCSNNCPYKVRRFNFLQYVDGTLPAAQRNPEVTVRQRGVMEKCTYCIQRIERTRIRAEREDRAIRDDELVTACQQVCPTGAIVFGDINDPHSRVSQAKSSPLDYSLLAELNTRPRTTYGALLRNPNPAMPQESET